MTFQPPNTDFSARPLPQQREGAGMRVACMRETEPNYLWCKRAGQQGQALQNTYKPSAMQIPRKHGAKGRLCWKKYLCGMDGVTVMNESVHACKYDPTEVQCNKSAMQTKRR